MRIGTRARRTSVLLALAFCGGCAALAGLGDEYTNGDAGAPLGDASSGEGGSSPDSGASDTGADADAGPTASGSCDTIDADFCCDFDRQIVRSTTVPGPCHFSDSPELNGTIDQRAEDGGKFVGPVQPGVVTSTTQPVPEAGPRANAYLTHSFGGGFKTLVTDIDVRRDDGTQLAGLNDFPVFLEVFFPSNGNYRVQLFVVASKILMTESNGTSTLTTTVPLGPHDEHQLHWEVTFDSTGGKGSARLSADGGQVFTLSLAHVPDPAPASGELHVGLNLDDPGPSGPWTFTYDDVVFDVQR